MAAASQLPLVWFPGERRTIVSCTRIVNKTTTLVNDSDCPQASRPEPQVRRCNLHPCQSRMKFHTNAAGLEEELTAGNLLEHPRYEQPSHKPIHQSISQSHAWATERRACRCKDSAV
ncbi:hypothetical protein P7K49_012768 [Saguinus oedipus]|uniref:Uncharacterized protein n=1 Tax=Saguinus oedipus TaxID=9490 RepID=A0ABQ9VG40_SAGOE|nr:hypothetical protein P7K49_012768 [Saguinus oedipus]